MKSAIDHNNKPLVNMPEFAFEVPEKLQLKFSGLIFSDGKVSNPNGDCAFIEKNAKGVWLLKHQKDGKLLNLTSPSDPMTEDLALFKRFAPKKNEGVLCLGLGLGYLLEFLHAHLRPETPIWLWESRPELIAATFMIRDLSPLWERDNFQVFTGFDDGEALLDKIDYAIFRPLARPNTMRFFAREYEKQDKKVTIQNKVRKQIKRTLICQSGYFLDREIMNAAEAIGLETAPWFFKREGSGNDLAFRDLLETIKNFSPDMIVTVNHLGFDSEGIMNDLFNSLKLPVASWFVDSPYVILSEAQTPASDFVSIFSWDKDYIHDLQYKFKNVFYLPLATDEKYFHPFSPAPRPTRCISFVGDSLSYATSKYLSKLGIGDRYLKQIDQLAYEFVHSKDAFLDQEMVLSKARLISRKIDQRFLDNFSALVIWRASRLKRLEVLKAMPADKLYIAGDKAWNSLLNIPAENIRQPVDYYNELCPFYQSSKININITSAQMKNGLNQRVFDVPAAGAFLLTDYRRQLEDLFDVGQEVIVYNSAQEAAEKAKWYLENESERLKVIKSARARILKEHLYRHRLQKLVDDMRDTYY